VVVLNVCNLTTMISEVPDVAFLLTRGVRGRDRSSFSPGMSSRVSPRSVQVSTLT
jgi:hypothetical protein